MNKSLEAARELHREGQLPAAIALYRQAVEADAGPAVAKELGDLLLQIHDLEGARQAYQTALASAPDDCESVFKLGTVLTRLESPGKAIACFRKAAELWPELAPAHFNLANLLYAEGQIEDSLRTYQRAVELEPDAAAFNNLGTAAARLERFEEASDAFRKALSLDDGFHSARCNLAQAMICCRQPQAAELQLRRLLKEGVNSDKVFALMLDVQVRLKQRSAAAATVADWLRHSPQHPVAVHWRAALSSEECLARASDEYVRQVFDDYAANFERQLARLEYSAPALVAQLLEKLFPTTAPELDVLDAGCGTGLCGPVLRPLARRLDGVDLSPGMLEKARERALYDELACAELTAYCQAHPGRYQLLVATDTLPYFGDLEPFCRAAAACLRPAGRLVFTIERLSDEQATAPFRLNATGRFSHTDGHVRQALAAARLRLESLEHAVLRLEEGIPVHGRLAVAALDDEHPA